ncbi:hypothetical protein BD626DRAFT_565339 [Schizophyllum amplum]|uniref:Uncharacterized protein n=1 Tax=Schizophyllum amplum TaxID=97359 RepID=A0A550CUP6_9AGAR|nr:hypothetical protein BD626DRAFT_565339 [Auriculariopsis ampla]
MSSRPGALQEQYNKEIPDPSDQSGYRATVETQRQDLVGADPVTERQEGTKLYARPEDVQTWETEKEPDPMPGQGRSSGGKSQGQHHNQDRPGRMEA